MKPLTLVLAFSTLLLSKLEAQTPEIAFKSHSGKMNVFHSDAARFFGVEKSNFGLPPYTDIYFLDSLIYESPGSVIAVKRQYRHYSNNPKDSMEFVRITRENVSNDPLFGRPHSLDSIRNVLKKENRYRNPVKKIVFVGFDNKKTTKKLKQPTPADQQQTLSPVYFANDDHHLPGTTTVDRQWLLMAGVILLLSLAGGWISWRWYAPKLQRA